MITTDTRSKIAARPRINTRESGDYESWHKRAIMSYADIVRIVGEEPADDCEGQGYCRRGRRCDSCYTREDWEHAVLDIVREATGWGLWGSGYGVEGCPGRPFADNASVYRHRRHPKLLIVSWSGGLDI